METYKSFFRTQNIIWAVILTIAGLFAISLLTTSTARAENERVITVFYDGIEKTVVTDAPTVEEVLKRIDVDVNKFDAVEPALNTKLVAPSYNINVYRARPVTVLDGNQRYTVMSPHTSARKIAEAAKLKLYDEDESSLERSDNFIGDGVGLKLTIKRATPLTLVLYGKASKIRTQSKTVGDLLKEKGIELGENDGVSPKASTKISEDMSVAVYRNGSQTVTQEKEVAFETETIQDADREVGYREVKTPGVKGRKVVTYQIKMVNGKEVSRKEIQSVVTVKPKKQVEVVGTKSAGFGGAFGEALGQLRQCEAGGAYDRNSGNGYYGAYQFSQSTWGNFGGYAIPSDAPPSVQDEAAKQLYMRRGWQPWPACSQKLGLQDSYR